MATNRQRKTHHMRKPKSHKKSHHKQKRQTKKYSKRGGFGLALSKYLLNMMDGNKKPNLDNQPAKNKKIDQAISELSSKLANPTENLGKMLSVMCKDPDNCLSMGQYIPMMKRFFNNFQDLSLVDIKSIKSLGEQSLNGYVFEIPFKKNGYTSYTVLKSTNIPSSDNLFYEYYVGKTFINKYIRKFPVFVETYDCYRYNSSVLANTFKNFVENSTNEITNLNKIITRIKHTDLTSISEFTKMFKDSCSEPETICILMQHFNNLTSFKTVFDEKSPNYQINKVDGPCLFYQLYFALSVLGDKYTHYDLHSENVCVYKPYSGQTYMLMRYHSNGSVYEFPSEYIVKLIDYGRNYINNGTVTTKEIVSDVVCKSSQCNPTCGKFFGYGIINGLGNANVSYNINPTQPNVSHDLRALNETNPDFLKNEDFYYKDQYGTPEDLTGDVNRIRSIHDLRATLETAVFPRYNDMVKAKYATWTKVAEMDVYDDGRDYEFRVI